MEQYKMNAIEKAFTQIISNGGTLKSVAESIQREKKIQVDISRRGERRVYLEIFDIERAGTTFKVTPKVIRMAGQLVSYIRQRAYHYPEQLLGRSSHCEKIISDMPHITGFFDKNTTFEQAASAISLLSLTTLVIANGENIIRTYGLISRSIEINGKTKEIKFTIMDYFSKDTKQYALHHTKLFKILSSLTMPKYSAWWEMQLSKLMEVKETGGLTITKRAMRNAQETEESMKSRLRILECHGFKPERNPAGDIFIPYMTSKQARELEQDYQIFEGVG